MPEMIKCQHCGTFVPSEKAFCPNCSEPMEVEDRPNRAHSFSVDMMSTIRDDPEKYKEIFLKPPTTNKPAAPAQPPQANAEKPAPVIGAKQANSAPSTTGYNNWSNTPSPAPMPIAQSGGKRNLILGISVIVLVAIVIILLFLFKVI